MRGGPTDEALLALARLVMDVSVRAADEMGGLSPVQLRALTVLRSSNGANLATLAEAMGVAVSTASRLVDRLTAAEWVHRRPAPPHAPGGQSHAHRRRRGVAAPLRRPTAGRPPGLPRPGALRPSRCR